MEQFLIENKLKLCHPNSSHSIALPDSDEVATKRSETLEIH